MSTSAQLQGDSLRRQIQLCEKYATEHGLELDDELKLHDIGVSAFDGSNVEKGALKAFLDAVERHIVAKGSTLLIESFDRLSRSHLQSSMTLLLRLLNSGITIVTLADGQVFVPGQTKPEAFMMSFFVMCRAHEESAQKSQRVSAAWANKRKIAKQKPLTARCPGWLRLSQADNKFYAIPERAELVRRMFQESIAGMGADAIARQLNREGLPSFGRSDGWHKSSIQKILSSRAVFGEFQPMKLIDGKRTPDGAGIEGYFPKIIDEAEFFSAQGAILSRRQGGGGRKGEKVSNLFSKVAVCGYCHKRMLYRNKGYAGGQFLVCDTAHRGLGCCSIPWKYLDFETSFLCFVKELDIASVLCDTKEQKEIDSTRAGILCIDGKLLHLRNKHCKLVDLYTESSHPEVSLKGMIHELDGEIAKLEEEKKKLEQSRLVLIEKQRNIKDSVDSIYSAITSLQDHSAGDIYKLRMAVSQKISSLADKVYLFPGGHLSSGSKNQEKIDLMVQAGFDREKVESLFPNRGPNDYKKHRAFVVMFRNGSNRLVRPTPENPTLYIAQLSSDGFLLGDSARDFAIPPSKPT